MFARYGTGAMTHKSIGKHPKIKCVIHRPTNQPANQRTDISVLQKWTWLCSAFIEYMYLMCIFLRISLIFTEVLSPILPIHVKLVTVRYKLYSYSLLKGEIDMSGFLSRVLRALSINIFRDGLSF